MSFTYVINLLNEKIKVAPKGGLIDDSYNLLSQRKSKNTILCYRGSSRKKRRNISEKGMYQNMSQKVVYVN